MKRSMMLIMLLAIGVAIAGCSQKDEPKREQEQEHAQKASPLVARFDIDYPGASPEQVDEMVEIFWQDVLALPGVRSITCISRTGVCEGYVTALPGTNPDELKMHLCSVIADERLPNGTGKPVICFVDDGIPEVTPKNIPSINVNLNKDNLARFGVSGADVIAKVNEVMLESHGSIKLEDVVQQVVTNRDGVDVRVCDVAEVEIVMKPDCIVRTFDSKGAER